jgi:hypothetical protein
MGTLIEAKLKEAMRKKETDINSFVWKGVKVLNNDGEYVQEEKRLVDMNEYDLNVCYDHCKKMLFNENRQHPGRYIVLDLIADQRDRCGVELFLRYVAQNYHKNRFTLMTTLTSFLKTNQEVFKTKTPYLKDAFNGLPTEFNDLSISLTIDGCLNQLGVFNKKHITRTFILKQGIWLTAEESKELITDKNNRLEIIRENLNLKDFERLYINSKGLDYTQMRAMLNIGPNKKYTDLTTIQLETLRNRILFSLEETIKKHIHSWEKRMEEIELVAKHNNYKL